jgi:hypothetical protein
MCPKDLLIDFWKDDNFLDVICFFRLKGIWFYLLDESFITVCMKFNKIQPLNFALRSTICQASQITLLLYARVMIAFLGFRF